MVLIYSTCPNKKVAQKIAKKLLSLKLVACANIIQTESFYIWDQKIQKSSEYVLILKTLKAKFKEIKKIIKENHPYQIPAILMIDVLNVDSNYFNWLKKELM